jgi:hypothetical protein
MPKFYPVTYFSSGSLLITYIIRADSEKQNNAISGILKTGLKMVYVIPPSSSRFKIKAWLRYKPNVYLPILPMMLFIIGFNLTLINLAIKNALADSISIKGLTGS